MNVRKAAMLTRPPRWNNQPVVDHGVTVTPLQSNLYFQDWIVGLSDFRDGRVLREVVSCCLVKLGFSGHTVARF